MVGKTAAHEANLRANDENIHDIFRLFPDLHGNSRALEMLNKVAILTGEYAFTHEEELGTKYNKGYDRGIKEGKTEYFNTMAKWFEDIDNASQEFIDSLEAELEGNIPVPVKIAMDKFKAALDEFSNKMSGE